MLADLLRSFQDRIHRLELLNARSLNSDAPASDPQRATVTTQVQPSPRTLRIRIGRIIDVHPFNGWYIVRPDDIDTTVVCCLGGDTSYGPTGPHRVGGVSPDAIAVFVMGIGDNVGAILALLPPWVRDPRQAPADYLSQFTATSPAGEPANVTLSTTPGANMQEFAAGRMLDDTSGGYGYISAETGVGFFISSDEAFFRADENAGVWFTYQDQFGRLAGHNLEIRSFGREYSSIDDEGEISTYDGRTPYVWEALGGLQPGTVVAQEFDVDTVQKSQMQKMVLDVVQHDQVAFHRFVTYGGYLGQGELSVVRLPPEGGSLYRLRTPGQQPTSVFGAHTSLDGSHYRRASGSVIDGVFPPFATPERIREPQDKQGDSLENGYGPLGMSGPPHKVAREPDPADLTHPLPGKLAAIDDMLAYAMEWQGPSAFHYHTKDFQASDHTQIQGSAEQRIDYNSLINTQFLKAPSPVEIKVDHRYTGKYYPVTAFDATTPDGARVFTGSCGEEIRFCGGSVIIGCPGDIILQSGRNTVVLAGRDAVLRAHENFEASASKGSVRIKSEIDFQLLAANSGTGHMLLECKSAGTDVDFADKVGSDVKANGIIIKSDGQFGVLSELVYMRSGAKSKAGWFRVDSATDVIVQAGSVQRFVNFFCRDSFGTDGTYSAVNTFGADVNNFGAGIRSVVGPSVFAGGVSISGDLSIIEGHVASSGSETAGGLVGSIDADSLAQFKDFFNEVTDDQKDDVQESEQYHEDVVAPAEEQNKIGNDDVVDQIGFSFRNAEQCKTEDWVLYELRWQQRLRMRGASGAKWQEKVVKAGSAETMPFPGNETWAQGECFLTLDPKLFDVTTGLPKPGRAEKGLYEDPKYPKPDKNKADGNYPIIPTA